MMVLRCLHAVLDWSVGIENEYVNAVAMLMFVGCFSVCGVGGEM